MNIFITSDQHFNHYNIIKYCDRPFKSVDDMNGYMINKWNSVVQPDDTVIVNGDWSMGNPERAFNIADKLMGKKILVYGNHDKNIRKHGYAKYGFSEAYENVIIPTYTLEKIFIEHIPDFNKAKDYKLYIYGHVHNEKLNYTPKNSWCSCVELHDYTPVNLNEILKTLG